MTSPVMGAKRLRADQLQIIGLRALDKRKSRLVAYLLWFFLGGFGVHNFYLGKFKLATFQLFGAAMSFVLAPADIDKIDLRNPDVVLILVMVSVGLVSVAYLLSLLADLFLIPSRVRSHSAKLREEYIAELSAKS
jgi:hypothetical protein